MERNHHVDVLAEQHQDALAHAAYKQVRLRGTFVATPLWRIKPTLESPLTVCAKPGKICGNLLICT